MNVCAIIPTIPGRERLLEAAVDSYLAGGLEVYVVEDSPSCGGGWRIGLERTDADVLWLLADDTELRDRAGLGEAVLAARHGRVVSPAVYWPDGRLQGAGGMGQEIPHGGRAQNAIFPFASRETFERVWPWPESNHFCDCAITEKSIQYGIGPVVSRSLSVVHKIVSPLVDGEVSAYDAWRNVHT